ncbi:MAG: hypothetical protein U0518_04585 [Candidatus Gracilibacteria bacterium]
MEGYIKLHRKMLEWEWYDDINTMRLFLHILLKANYADKKWKGKMIKRGEFITSRDKLSKETGLSDQQIRTCLTRLKSTNEITSETTSYYTKLTIEKYDLYQGEITNQATNEQPANNQRITTTKERKNNTNINISINTYRQFAHLSISQDEFQKLITLGFSKVQIDEILDQIENYKGNTKYKSLFLTTKNWLEKSSAKKEKPSHERDRDNFNF